MMGVAWRAESSGRNWTSERCCGLLAAVEIALLTALVLLFLLLVLHDLVPIGRWNNLERAAGQVSRGKLAGQTVWVGLLGGVPLVLSYISRGVRHATWQRETATFILAFLFVGELLTWWIPYFFGARAGYAEGLRPIFEGTLTFLPERNGLTVNALHCVVHGLTLLALVLSVLVKWR